MSRARLVAIAAAALLLASCGGGDDCEIEIHETPAPVQGQPAVNVPSCN